MVICNFTPVPRDHYRLGLPEAGYWKMALNSDDVAYGGSGYLAVEGFQTAEIPSHGYEHSIEINVPPLATVMLKRVG